MENKKILSFEASTELKEALRKQAYLQDVSVSKLIRMILEKELLVLTEGDSTNGETK